MTTLTEKLARIKRDIGAVGKDSKMTEGPAKYAYRGIDSILSAAHDGLIRHEVTIVPVDAEPTYESRTTKNGGHAQWVSLKVRWEVRSGDEMIPGCSIGEALDYSDKATNKAHTAAHKVFLSELFAIPYSTEDPDDTRVEIAAPAPPAPVDRITAYHHEAILARIHALPKEVQDAIKPLVKAGPKLSEMTADQTGEAEAFLDLMEGSVS